MQILKRLCWTWLAAVLSALALLAAAPAETATADSTIEASRPTRQQNDQTDPRDQQIARLIEQLGDKEYFVRQQAQTELAKFGFEAFDALNAATTHEDLEIAARARYLLRLMRVEWTAKNDPAEVKKLLADYEMQTMSEKVRRMRALADLPERAGLPALCRLVRYEKSSVCSKQAAIQLFRRGPGEVPPGKDLAEGVRKSLDHSNRAAARWLLAWLRFGDDPGGATSEWTKLVDEEQARLQTAPSETSPEIVAALLRFQIDWLKKLGQLDKAVAAMRRLIDLEQGDPETLAELLDWLVKQKAWKVVEELAQRFHPQFRDHAVLLYTLAQAYAEQGDQARAEATAEQARKLNPGKELEPLIFHFTTAHQLRQRGMFAWAEQEYRHVIANGPAGHPLTATAYLGLGEMFHDRGEDLQAAKVLEELIAAAEKEKPARTEIADRPPGEIRSRMHHFYAEHFQSRNDQAQQRAHLLQALESDAPDIDALIACYRRADLGGEKHQEVRELIKKTAAELQEEIGDDPKNAATYNQFAWLVGNTEGDVDLALKYSKKSLELSPDNGGFYDTLAHVYFAKGDYENAVQTQTRAAELEPHSGLILRQLKFFREKLPPRPQKEKPAAP
jgi:tetratricopeptide (TPR) repeat protein